MLAYDAGAVQKRLGVNVRFEDGHDMGRNLRKKFDENQRKRAEGIAENFKPHTREAKERERKKRLEEHNKLIEAKVGTGV